MKPSILTLGVPKEVKNHEYRAGLIPPSVHELTARGIPVIVETQTGAGMGFSDDDYRSAGALIVDSAQDVFDAASLIIKVKEPQPHECAMLTPKHTLFTYLHLAPDPDQAKGLVNSGACAIAYETITDHAGRLPLLTPMSEVAGRMSVQAGAHMLERTQGGTGILLSGASGVNVGRVLILGGGVVGYNAARMAIGMGAHVTIMDRSPARLMELDALFQGRVETLYASTYNIQEAIKTANLVIGAVLLPGQTAPRLVTRDMLSTMIPGSVLVDVSIDQGGCFETSRVTTHESPSFVLDGIVHYCVANMPGAVPRTSATALNNATLPYILKLVDQGVRHALENDPHMLRGLNVCRGFITYHAVAEALGYPYKDPKDALSLL